MIKKDKDEPKRKNAIHRVIKELLKRVLGHIILPNGSIFYDFELEPQFFPSH